MVLHFQPYTHLWWEKTILTSPLEGFPWVRRLGLCPSSVLVRELRPHMLHRVAKKQNKQNEN